MKEILLHTKAYKYHFITTLITIFDKTEYIFSHNKTRISLHYSTFIIHL